MIQLSKSEAKMYEYLKRNLNQEQICRLTGIGKKNVLDNLHVLVKTGLATVTYHGRFPTFAAVPGEYEIVNRHKKAVAQ